MANQHLKELNLEQKKAVLKTEGPVLIIAGAGAGKTRTITHRIHHLIKTGVPPSKILAITFTNKAAKEMEERVEKLLSADQSLNRPITMAERPFIATFHALSVRILRQNSKLLDLPRNFAIYDRSDSLRTIKEAMKLSGVDPKSFEPTKILRVISREKGNMVTAELFAERTAAGGYFRELVAAVWRQYDKILATEKALDFDDLLLKATVLLKQNTSVRRHYQEIWRYFHVDEYQDTNIVQYKMTKLLAEQTGNLCVVGDIDQNIYSWRGADIKNLLDFEKDYPKATVILLEQNYRSTKTILAVANRVIQKNKLRREKNLFTENPAGEKIGLFAGYDETAEADFLSSKAKEIIQGGVSPKEIAIFYRANFQSRAIEEAFLNAKLPYQVIGVGFFGRAEVKNIVSYLRAALDQQSLSDLKRIINVPSRGIGMVALAKILSGRENELRPATKIRLEEFRDLLSQIANKARTAKLSETIKFIIEKTTPANRLENNSEEDEETLGNLMELVSFSVRYDGLRNSDEAIEKFLSDVALASDQDELLKKSEAVRLMTVHAAKGLEFDYVFITGLESNLFPHKKIYEETITENEVEEERRLFYVALTRARKKIYLSYANIRTIFGLKQPTAPSEFIFEIEDDLVQIEEPPEGGGKVISLD